MIVVEEKVNKKLPGFSSLFVSFSYNPDIVSVLRSIPSCVYSTKDKTWEVPLTQFATLVEKLCLYDDIECHFLKYKEKKFEKYSLSKYKTSPFNYQIDGIEYGLNNDCWLLLDAPGLGKSLQMIYLAEELRKREKISHCLIVCGVNTLKTNWKKEIQQHSSLSCKILGEKVNSKGNYTIGSVKDRLDDLKKDIKEFFIITNIETLRDDDIVKALQTGHNKIDMCVVDEIHTCKSPTSLQGKHLLKLNKFKYKIGLTGTLLLNNPLDAYVPLKWIGAERVCYTDFRYYYCNYGGPFHNILTGFKNLDQLKFQLDKCSLRRTKDLLNLPDKIIINEYVEMNDKQLQLYNNIKQGVISQVDKVKMTPASILGMVARFRQVTACPSMLTTEHIESSKLNRAKDLAEQLLDSGEKVVIFSTFKESVYELAKELKQYSPLVNTGDIKDSIISDNVDKFQQDSNSKLFLATWQKCGTGITLTAASYVIFIDTPWTEGVYTQAQDRCYRIGTKKSVTVYHLICKDTIDERVLEILGDKSAIADYIVDDKITTNSIESLKKWIEELN